MNKKKKYKLIPFQQILDEKYTSQEQKMLEARARIRIVMDKVRTYRKKRKMTQAQLAQKANLPRTTISKIESGYQNVSILKIVQIAEALNKNVEIRFVDKGPAKTKE